MCDRSFWQEREKDEDKQTNLEQVFAGNLRKYIFYKK